MLFNTGIKFRLISHSTIADNQYGRRYCEQTNKQGKVNIILTFKGKIIIDFGHTDYCLTCDSLHTFIKRALIHQIAEITLHFCNYDSASQLVSFHNISKRVITNCMKFSIIYHRRVAMCLTY